jgi:hypothetical protein
MVYIAVSRGASDAQIFANDRGKLAESLGRNVSRESAHKAERAISPVQQMSRNRRNLRVPLEWNLA